jgi:hypothetical protein
MMGQSLVRPLGRPSCGLVSAFFHLLAQSWEFDRLCRGSNPKRTRKFICLSCHTKTKEGVTTTSFKACTSLQKCTCSKKTKGCSKNQDNLWNPRNGNHRSFEVHKLFLGAILPSSPVFWPQMGCTEKSNAFTRFHAVDAERRIRRGLNSS